MDFQTIRQRIRPTRPDHTLDTLHGLDNLPTLENASVDATLPHRHNNIQIVMVGVSINGEKQAVDRLLMSSIVQPPFHQDVISPIKAIDLMNTTQAHTLTLDELEYADLIFYVIDSKHGLTTDNLKWLNRIQSINVPVVILLGHAERISKRTRLKVQQKLQDRINRPVVSMLNNDDITTRQALVHTVYQLSPKIAATMAIQAQPLRSVLAQQLIDSCTFGSMIADYTSTTLNGSKDTTSLAEVQVRLVRQISVIYGNGHRLTRSEHTGLSNLIEAVSKYTSDWVNHIPRLSDTRRIRLSNAMSTLLIGYLAMVYQGEQSPLSHTKLLPQIWKLYRATATVAKA